MELEEAKAWIADLNRRLLKDKVRFAAGNLLTPTGFEQSSATRQQDRASLWRSYSLAAL
jgi:hypothetical protein